MRFGYTILYVDDANATADFYEAAFGLGVRMRSEGGEYVEMDTGTTLLGFALRSFAGQHVAAGPANPEGATFELGLVTDDVAAAVDRAVTAGAGIVMEPTEMPWGQTVAYVRDPNEFVITLCSPVDEH